MNRYYIGSDGQRYRTLTANSRDETPVYRHWETGKYRAECSCCWLNISHSEAKHAANFRLTDKNAWQDACQDSFDRAAGLL